MCHMIFVGDLRFHYCHFITTKIWFACVLVKTEKFSILDIRVRFHIWSTCVAVETEKFTVLEI